MEPPKHPTYGHGKLCYIELPALDIQRSASFYQASFGWHIRQRGDGRVAFDDGVGEVSGAWVLGRKPMTEPGLLVYIMVDSVAATCETVVAHGGRLMQPIGADLPEITARFADPAGNILGLYQQPIGNHPDREILSSRLIAAPHGLVWQAWTDPKHLAQWWGPDGFRNTFHEFDPRPGGHWRLVMHGPNGADYPNHSVFLDLKPPGRMVFDHISPPRFLVVATFEERNHQTQVAFRMIFNSAADCEKLKAICVPANEQNFDRLEAELRRMA